MNWSDASEIVCGLVLNGRLLPTSVLSEHFIPPYDSVIRIIQENKNISVEDLIEKCGLLPVQNALEAAKSVNGLGDKNWSKILEQTATYYQAGIKLEEFSKRLKRGDDVDWSLVTYYAQLAEQNKGSDFVPLSQIRAAEFPFIETGWKPIDDHLGGIPKIGLILVGGVSHSGKTTFWVTLSSKFAKQYKDKKIAFFSLEMIAEEVKARYETISNLTPEEQERILINPHPVTVEEVIAKSAAIPNLGLIGIDFADLLIQGETTESVMSNIYRTLAMGSKKLGCPIVLLAQLSNYSGGIPRPNNFRWTRLAEALAWMVLMIYNPTKDWFGTNMSDSVILPAEKGAAYIIAWKCRGGFRKHPDDSPGAILVPFRGDLGWGNKSRWFAIKEE